jgi:transcriptional regulator with XRE-family HTH domain
MSTQTSTDLAQRIRQLRGEKSQAEFARFVGLTRSALANYETGRTTPKPSLLREISLKLGISEDFLLSGRVRNEYEFNYVATGKGFLNDSFESRDELSLLRVMRAARPNNIARVVGILLDDISDHAESREELKGVTAQHDLARLGEILRANGAYEKGSTGDANDALLQEFANRAKGK